MPQKSTFEGQYVLSSCFVYSVYDFKLTVVSPLISLKLPCTPSPAEHICDAIKQYGSEVKKFDFFFLHSIRVLFLALILGKPHRDWAIGSKDTNS